MGASIHQAERQPNRMKSRSHEIGYYNDRIALTRDRLLDSAALEVPVKFQSDLQNINMNITASGHHEILR